MFCVVLQTLDIVGIDLVENFGDFPSLVLGAMVEPSSLKVKLIGEEEDGLET